MNGVIRMIMYGIVGIGNVMVGCGCDVWVGDGVIRLLWYNLLCFAIYF